MRKETFQISKISLTAGLIENTWVCFCIHYVTVPMEARWYFCSAYLGDRGLKTLWPQAIRPFAMIFDLEVFPKYLLLLQLACFPLEKKKQCDS